MTSMQDLMPDHLRVRIEAIVESRLQSVGDLSSRRLPLLNSYKIGSSAELAVQLLSVLHTLSDREKRDLIKMLELTISDIDSGSVSD
jgi:hypothetical protein